MNPDMRKTAGPLRVVMFTNLYPPVVSGSATQSSMLARQLVQRDCRVAVITANVIDGQAERERVDGVDVYRLPALRLPRLPIALNFPWLSYTFTPSNLRRIGAILTQHAPDVLHLHNHMFDLALGAVLMRRRRRLPLVTTIHTMIRHAQPLYNAVLCPLDRVLLRHLVIRQSAAVICPDWNIKQYVESAFQRSDTVVLPYGIPAPVVPPAAQVAELRRRFDLVGKRVLLSLGHVHALRDRKELIEALPAVRKVFPNTVLLIVGAVSTPVPAATARRLGVEEAVRFAGHQPHDAIPALFALADLEAHWLTQDSPEKTSLGVASMEAMNAGKAVLVAANENTFGPGILRDGENLVLVQPGNPQRLARRLIELLADEDQRQAIGRRAAETIRTHFSWERICAQTINLYRELSLRRKAHAHAEPGLRVLPGRDTINPASTHFSSTRDGLVVAV